MAVPVARDHGRGVRATWLYTLSSILFFVATLDAFLLFLVVERAASDPGPLTAVLAVAFAVAVAVQLRYTWFLRVGRGGGLPAVGWTLALLAPAALAWVVGLFLPGGGLIAALPLWVAGCLVAALLPTRMRWAVIAVGVAVTVGHPLLAGSLGQSIDVEPGMGFVVLIFPAMLPFMVLTSLWWWEIVVELDRHRRIAGELAVTQERLRFASDLHDIQGHHLQVISLKSELAERLLPIDPDAAREHLRETRLIAKQALEETRRLVAGYREIALDDELENAGEVLAAAGARCELQVGELPTDAATRRVLAAVVREATTNILRHSEARHVRVALATSADRITLEIVNDGVTEAPDVAGRAPGNGIAGLQERLAAVGGRLDASLAASGDRFELRATVPVVAPPPAAAATTGAPAAPAVPEAAGRGAVNG